MLFCIEGGSEKRKLFNLNITDMKIFQPNKKQITVLASKNRIMNITVT